MPCCGWRIAVISLLLISAVARAEDDPFVKRLTSLDPKTHADVLVEWTQALQEVTEEDVSTSAVLLFLPKLDALYDKNDRFQPAISKRFVERIKNLPKERLTEWQDATDAVGGSASMTTTVVRLIQTERLFSGSTVKKDELNRLIARLKALTEDMFADWIDATEFEEGEALFSLVQNDALFDARNVVRLDAFKKALEATKSANSN